MSDNLADKQKPPGSAKMADEAVVPQVNTHIAASMLAPGPFGAHQMLPQQMASLFDYSGVKAGSLNFDPGNPLTYVALARATYILVMTCPTSCRRLFWPIVCGLAWWGTAKYLGENEAPVSYLGEGFRHAGVQDE